MSFFPRQEWDSDTVWLLPQCHLPTQQCRQVHWGLTLCLSLFVAISLPLYLEPPVETHQKQWNIPIVPALTKDKKVMPMAEGLERRQQCGMIRKADHIIQHYRSNEAVIFKEEENSCPRRRGENLLAAWDHQEFIQWLHSE